MNAVKSVAMLSLLVVALWLSAGCSSSNMENSNQQSNTNTVGSADNNAHTSEQTKFDLNEMGYQIIERLGGYPLILTAKQIVAISDVATTTAIGSIELDSIDLSFDSQAEPEVTPFRQTQYFCEQGGQMIVRKAVFAQSAASYSQSVDRSEYIFDNCSLLTGGEQVLNGSMRVFDEILFDVAENKVDRSITWTDFSWQKANNTSLKINAEIQLLNRDAITTVSSREVEISTYELMVDNKLEEAAYNSKFLLLTKASNSRNIQEYTLNVNGTAVSSAQVSVEVSNDPELNRKLVSAGINVEPVPFNGRIIMLADDQSMLILEANAQSTQNNTLQVDKIYTDKDGNTSIFEAQIFIDLPILAF